MTHIAKSSHNLDSQLETVDVVGSNKSNSNTATGTEMDTEKGTTAAEPARPMHPILWNLMIIFGVFIYGSYTILVHLCEKDGVIPFSSASMVFVTETTKLVLSLTMYSPEVRERGSCNCPTWKLIVPFAIPAILYCINNNLAVYIQLQMDPATYQVLGNFKILSTAILFRLIIKKPITLLQWGALGILIVAGVSNSYGGLMGKATTGASSAGTLHITVKGLIMISCYCTISGLAGVYTEYVLKKQKQMSIHLQNSLLYIFGMILNGITFVGQASQFEDKSYGFNLFHGYTFATWLVILTQALGGIIMGVIMKHASNITRLFLISTAMLVTTILSVIIFGLQLNIYFCLAFVFVILAIYLYHK